MDGRGAANITKIFEHDKFRYNSVASAIGSAPGPDSAAMCEFPQQYDDEAPGVLQQTVQPPERCHFKFCRLLAHNRPTAACLVLRATAFVSGLLSSRPNLLRRRHDRAAEQYVRTADRLPDSRYRGDGHAIRKSDPALRNLAPPEPVSEEWEAPEESGAVGGVQDDQCRKWHSTTVFQLDRRIV